jgi:phospholipid-transporting ATPase
VDCAHPNKELYRFDSRLFLARDRSDDPLALSADQLLLQGAILRNVDWVYGVVVYTGMLTLATQRVRY